MMTKKLPFSTVAQNWRELYQDALCETDQQKLSFRIAEAERALILRTRELFKIFESDTEEAKALDKGLYALRALRTCLKLKTDAHEAA
jgi:hypothetical protein